MKALGEALSDTGQPIGGVLPWFVPSLVEVALAGELIIYAGAGASRSSGLPSGEELAERLHAALSQMGVDVADIEPWDLLALGDAAEAEGSIETLQDLALTVADFRDAVPSLPHIALALLLLEGAIEVLTTNWDTCFERAVAEEVLCPVVTDEDRRNYRGALLYKVHGCAHRPRSLLISRRQLSQPPVWADADVASALGRATVAFVGIGDVAPYVRIRLSKLLEQIGDADNVRVVSPSIASKWETTQWANLLPTLSDGSKLEFSAADFADLLLRGWVRSAVGRWTRAATDAGKPALVSSVAGLRDMLFNLDAVTVVKWLRSSQLQRGVPRSAVHSPITLQAMLALSWLRTQSGGTSSRLIGDRFLADPNILLLVADGGIPARRVAEEAHRRAQHLRASGAVEPDAVVTVLCAGHFGALAPQSSGAEDDVLGPSDPHDLMDGPLVGASELLSAHVVLDGVA